MADLQKSGDMERWLDQHAEEIGMEDWSALCERVNEMAYARVVGPYSNELEVSFLCSNLHVPDAEAAAQKCVF